MIAVVVGLSLLSGLVLAVGQLLVQRGGLASAGLQAWRLEWSDTKGWYHLTGWRLYTSFSLASCPSSVDLCCKRQRVYGSTAVSQHRPCHGCLWHQSSTRAKLTRFVWAATCHTKLDAWYNEETASCKMCLLKTKCSILDCITHLVVQDTLCGALVCERAARLCCPYCPFYSGNVINTRSWCHAPLRSVVELVPSL